MPFVLMFLAGAFSAQEIPQTETIMTQTVATTSDGRPNRCEIQFIAITRDDVDGPGKTLDVNGTFGFEFVPGSPPFQMVKLSYREIDGERMGPEEAPASVSLVGVSGASNVAQRGHQMLGEDGRSLIAGFHIAKGEDVTSEWTTKHRFKLLFNRQPGYGDVLVDVDLLVQDRDGDNVLRSSKMLRSSRRAA